MIIVKVELLSAITGETTELAKMHIINDGTGSSAKGNYTATSYRGRSKEQLDKAFVMKITKVTNWPRLQLHVWNLVHKALHNLGYTNGM